MPTTSLQAGLAALVAFDPSADAATNSAALAEVAGELATGAVTVASRDVHLDGLEIHKGSVARTRER